MRLRSWVLASILFGLLGCKSFNVVMLNIPEVKWREQKDYVEIPLSVALFIPPSSRTNGWTSVPVGKGFSRALEGLFRMQFKNVRIADDPSLKPGDDLLAFAELMLDKEPNEAPRGVNVYARITYTTPDGSTLWSGKGHGAARCPTSDWARLGACFSPALAAALNHFAVSPPKEIVQYSKDVMMKNTRPAALTAAVDFIDDQAQIPNGILDAAEDAKLKIRVQNKGAGKAFGVRIRLNSNDKSVQPGRIEELGDLAPGQARELTVDLKGKPDLRDGTAAIIVEATESRGFNAQKVKKLLKTAHLEPPDLVLGEASVNDRHGARVSGNGNGVIENGETCELIVPLENRGRGAAVGVIAALQDASGSLEVIEGSQRLGTILAGRAQSVTFLVRLPVDRSLRQLRGTMTVSDARGVQNIRKAFSLTASRLQPALSSAEIKLFDGNSSRSKGNSNGRVESGETIEIEVVPANDGNLAARGVSLSVAGPIGIAVSPRGAALGDIPIGNRAMPQRFVFTVPRSWQGPGLSLEINYAQKDFPGAKERRELSFVRLGPLLERTSFEVVDSRGTGRLEQGDEADIVISFKNRGTLAAEGVSAQLMVGRTGVVAARSEVPVGTISPGQTATAVFHLSATRGAAPGPVPLRLKVSQADFAPKEERLSFSLFEENPLEDGSAVSAVGAKATTTGVRPSLAIDTVRLDDENSDGIWEEDERVGLVVRLRNDGPGKAVGVTAALAGPEALVAALGSEMRVGDIEAGGQREAEFAGVLRKSEDATGSLRLEVRDARFAALPTKTIKVPLEASLSKIPRYGTPKRRNAFAVVIGIEKYRGELTPAPSAAADARLVHEYFVKALNIPLENIKLLINDRASSADIKGAVEDWLKNRVGKGGEVFFYYSGHGSPNPATGESYLLPYDGNPDALQNTAYSLKQLYSVLGRMGARGSLVVLDSCFSGAGGSRTLLARGARPLVNVAKADFPGAGAILSASGGAQISGIYEKKKQGLLTYYFVRGLKGDADANGDKKIGLEELYEYLKPQVVRQARRDNREQEPQLRMEGASNAYWRGEPLAILE